MMSVKRAAAMFGVIFAACIGNDAPGTDGGTTADPVASGAPVARAAVVRSWLHDREAWTQGLDFDNGRLYEGTGLEGKSTLREISLQDARVIRKVDLQSNLFGEGITILGNRIYQLTWKAERGFVYDLATLRRLSEFTYDGEGWGLTNDGQSLIMSDGTATLRFLDPATFTVQRTVTVKDGETEIGSLNELEWVNGQIWANVWQADSLARIDPASGQLLGWVDLSMLMPPSDIPRYLPPGADVDVLNGIAYDERANRLVVTGKNWPLLYEIRVDTAR